MTHKLKTLGVALFAVLALTAVPATYASAASFTASMYPTTVTGESGRGNGTFITEAGSLECKTHFEATLTAASTQLTAKPVFTECTAFGGLFTTTVAMNGCDFLFTTPSGSGDTWSAPADILCPGGGVIQVIAGPCEFTVGPQKPGGSVSVANNTASGDVSIRSNLTGISYTVIKDGFGCPFNGTGPKTGASHIHHSAVTLDSTNGAVVDIG